MIVCILLTVLIFYSHYSLLASFRFAGLVHRILTATVLTLAQIVLTELALGLLSALHPSLVIAINLSVALAVFLAARNLCSSDRTTDSGSGLRAFRQNAAEARDWYTLTVGILVVLVYTWILAASYFLPPRGIDDLVYHLPAV